tara:strand:- start:244 stop:720 length:477 start_codon:yes stop_codon:yes gene_type:complete
MNSKEFVINWFENHIWARPFPSKICDGVGAVAIRDIPKGTSVWDLAPKSVKSWVEWEDISHFSEGLLRCVYDIQAHCGVEVMDEDFTWSKELGPLWMYTTKDINYQSTWFFQNYSDTPNLDAFSRGNRDFYFIANCDIKKGEELTESLYYEGWYGNSD